MLFDDCDELEYQSIMYSTRVAAEFTKWHAEFVKIYRGKLWGLIICYYHVILLATCKSEFLINEDYFLYLFASSIEPIVCQYGEAS